jgi:hypothetical protein
MTKTIQQRIEMHKKAIEELELKQKQKEEMEKNKINKKDYIYLDKFKCWILPEVILKNKTFEQQKAEIPKGCEIATYEIIQYCRDNNLHECFRSFWVNIPNPDKMSMDKGYIAGFVAYSGWAFLVCGRNPSGAGSSLGVFVIRRER